MKNYSSKEILKMLQDDGWYIGRCSRFTSSAKTPNQSKEKLQFHILRKVFLNKLLNQYLSRRDLKYNPSCLK